MSTPCSVSPLGRTAVQQGCVGKEAGQTGWSHAGSFSEREQWPRVFENSVVFDFLI